MLNEFQKFKNKVSKKSLERIKSAALNQKNIFEVLMEASKHCSLRSNYQCFI